VPTEAWGMHADIATLALDAEWAGDLADNLIALPADTATYAQWRGSLPMHRGPHPQYNLETAGRIAALRRVFPNPTPLEAKAILEDVARQNRIRILRGDFNPIIKVSQ
jgi:hypothetical protein